MANRSSSVPFEAVVDTASTAILVFEPRHDGDGRIVDFAWRYANSAAEALARCPLKALVGRSVPRLIPEIRQAGLLDEFVTVMDTGSQFGTPIRWESEVFAGSFDLQARRAGDFLVVTITEQSRQPAPNSVRADSRSVASEVFSRVSDAVLAVDHDWVVRFVNPEAAELLGRRREDLVDRTIWQAIPDSEGSDTEVHFRAAQATGKRQVFEAYYPAPLDTWCSVRAYPDPNGLTIFLQDVGARRRFEQRLAEMERMESLATMAGGIAHDFNNLLMVVSGHASILAEDLAVELGEGHPALEDVAAIRGASERAADLTRQLLTFSRRQNIRPVTMDLNLALERALPSLRNRMGDERTVEAYPFPEPLLVDVDPLELDRAILNLAVNAADAMAPGGRLIIETSRAQPTQSRPEGLPVVSHYALLTITDTGRGMDSVVLSRAAEPFFTTKADQSGSGLGLSAVVGMANQAGGYVSLYSEPGLGTTVRIYLPVSPSDTPTAEPVGERQVTHPAVGGESILVVDDNASVRELIQRILTEDGYRVVTASSADEALQVLPGLVRDLDLLVTDVIMPGLTGHELALSLRRLAGEVPVLYVSGFTQNTLISKGIPDSEVEFLAKPFALSDLTTRVRSMLERRHSAEE